MFFITKNLQDLGGAAHVLGVALAVNILAVPEFEKVLVTEFSQHLKYYSN